MIFEITPDYELFVAIIFVWWVIGGVLSLACGLAQSENKHRDNFGGVEIIKGAVILLLAAWAVF